MLRIEHPRDRRENRIGKTSILDLGPDCQGWTGRHGLADLLESAGGYIDMAKIWGLNAATMPDNYLKSVCAQYRDAGVHTFAGGLLFEYAWHKGEIEGLIERLKFLGLLGIEVSENYLELSEADRNAAIARFTDEGLDVVFEFGRKVPDVAMELDALKNVVEGAMAAGAVHVVMEQGEFDLISETRPEILAQLPKQDWFQHVFIEMDHSGFPKQHSQMIETFGPDVNLANVMPGNVIRLEGLRRGLGRSADFPYFKALMSGDDLWTV